MNWYFVCTGNICRSALGQAYLAHQLRAIGSDARVASGGTGINQALVPTPEIRVLGARLGVDSALAGHLPQMVNTEVLEAQDLILCATTGHRAQVLALAPQLLHRVFTLKEFAFLLGKVEMPAAPEDDARSWWGSVLEGVSRQRSLALDPAMNLDIADPYRESMTVYEKAGQEIVECCAAIVEAERYRLTGEGAQEVSAL